MAAKDSPTVRITTAPSSASEDIAGRQRRYLVSMAIRTACVIGAVVVGPGILRWVLVAGAVLLPYVAVVLANATQRKDDGFELRETRAERELR
ncbi:DUF3099 domain-containing protein [Nocardioides piscis]|uniref:DUF3099 domain-containing protein n=1 Tax=Nocardioides piscis TaxID=2714938 RepID=A0A6G7YIL0_9ACTN|nr:DUF3099 domain-containing protein [Nocardioides piscis]QIK76580.1 DUF3099 domain-containing protein [Nocardioides piscis]